MAVTISSIDFVRYSGGGYRRFPCSLGAGFVGLVAGGLLYPEDLRRRREGQSS